MSHTDPSTSTSATRHAPLAPGRPRLAVPLFFGLLLGMFVVGELYLGLVFLANPSPPSGPAAAPTLDVPVAGPVAPPQGSTPPPERAGPVPSGGGQPSAARDPLPDWQEETPVGILLLGLDKRRDEPVETARSDTMLLLMVDPRTRVAALVSLPRDLWVQIPGYGEQRINVAHAVGGPALAKRTVEQNFGVRVDHFARVDFRGFERIVDTLGGVLVEVERPIDDTAYPTENYGTTRVSIPSGPQLMAGERALQYVRSRHSEDDFGRMRRQQRFLLALRERALQLDIVPKLPSLLGLARNAVTTDLGPAELLGLARLASEVQPDKIATLVLDTRYVAPYRSPEGADLLLPKKDAIRAALRDLLAGAEQPRVAEATIEVPSGTRPAAPAQAVADDPAVARPTPRPSPTGAPTAVAAAPAGRGPAETIRRHYQLIDERRYDEGYQLMSARLRAQRSPATYKSWFADKVSLRTVSVALVSRDGARAVVDAVVDTADRVQGSTVEWRVAERFVLALEDGTWRIDQVTRL